MVVEDDLAEICDKGPRDSHNERLERTRVLLMVFFFFSLSSFPD